MTRTILRCCANFFMAISLSGGVPDAALVEELRVYRLPWHILTRHDLKPSDVRSMTSSPWKTRSTSAICEVLSVLPIAKLAPCSASSPDLRLVVDIKFKNGAESSYYSDGQFLYSADMKSRIKIDQSQINERLLDRLELLQ